jgi:hypothetical protein
MEYVIKAIKNHIVEFTKWFAASIEIEGKCIYACRTIKLAQKSWLNYIPPP